MEAEYDEVLHWEVPGPVEPGESSSWQVLFNHWGGGEANSITDGR